jgi:chitodextrinase
MAPDTTNKSYLLEVDGGNCYNVGGGSMSANTWTWVDYQSGSTSNKVQQSLSAGSHSLKLIGNAPGVKIDRVIATSDTGCTPTGNGDNCNTPNDTVAPTVTLTAPKEGASVTGSVALTATATDNTGVARVEFYDNTTLVGSDTSSPYSFNWDSSKVANGSHLITARAYDAAGNVGSDSNTVTAKNGDIQAPGTPTGLSAAAQSYNSVKLTWKASTDNTGVTGYTVYRDSVPVATVGNVTTYTDNNLSANTSYSYQLQAMDAAGNKSGMSTKVTAKTQNVADSTAPSTPTGLSAQTVSSTQVNLTWTAATDNIGVTGYDVYRSTGPGSAQKVGTTATNSYGDSNLTAGTSYSYHVVAKDAAGNASQPSDTVSVTTPRPPAKGTRTRIKGTITNQRTGKPVPYSTVKIIVNGHKETYRADRFGRYVMYRLKPGRYNVVYKANGYYSKTVSVDLTSTPITQNVSLKKR